ncbi:hypothetical protein [uncultured Methanobrevibacter sp.]|nr:hypothetical protein [uncultured Methanobrevibacter sp.]
MNIKCPFCGENLIEGELVCQNCRSLVIDFDYLENMRRWRRSIPNPHF